METISTTDILDHSRWLMDNGLLNDVTKNNLFTYGTIVNKEVQAVELDIDVTTFTLKYTIYFNIKMLKTIEKYNTLCKSASIIGMWKFKRILKEYGSLNLQAILQKFVTDYCGKKWRVEMQLKDVSTYKESKSETEPRGNI